MRVAAVRRRHAPADERDRRRHLRRALLDEGQEVRVGDLLLGIGQGDRLAVDRVERVALELVAELAELALEAAPAGQLADRQLAAGQPDRLGGHDLVGQRVLDDAVLVDPRLVGEGVAADDRLVGLDREPGEVADQPAGRRDLLGLDAAAELGGTASGRVRRAITTSSSEALPARSPRPLMVTSTWRAPAWTAASVLAVARPRSLWQWTLTVASRADPLDDAPDQAGRTRPGWRSRRCRGC